MNIELLTQELVRDEGKRYQSYRDSLGLWTIGVGHLLSPGDHLGLSYTEDQVQKAFDSDLQVAIALAQSLPAYPILDTDSRQRAIVNMCYNLGHRILTFNTFLSLLQQKKWKEAGEDLRTTVWYRQVPVRANRIIQMIETGQ